jgi:hypothetical protein
MSAQLMTKFKRADLSRAELTMKRASQRATSILSSPSWLSPVSVSLPAPRSSLAYISQSPPRKWPEPEALEPTRPRLAPAAPQSIDAVGNGAQARVAPHQPPTHTTHQPPTHTTVLISGVQAEPRDGLAPVVSARHFLPHPSGRGWV